MNTSTSQLHVIFGAGPVGLAVMDELVRRGKRVRVVNRSGKSAHVPAGVEIVGGDATQIPFTTEAAKGASVVYNCTNAPDYHKWPEQFPPLHTGVLEGAAANGAKLVLMENVYMYGDVEGQPITEKLPFKAKGKRGITRVKMVQEWEAAHKSGRVQVTAGRASDFFGPRVRDSAGGEQVFNAAIKGEAAQVLFHADQPHSFTYMSDIGKALVILGQSDQALGRAWHIPNAPALTTREFIAKIFAFTGKPPKFQVASPLIIKLLGLVAPPLRGIEELGYEFTKPFVVEGNEFTKTFGIDATPLDEAIQTTLTWYQQQAKS
jgi:nucleoside-diphosphate-sugar epimerase